MTRALPLYAMAPETSFDGMALIERMLPNFEIVQHIREVMEPLRDDAGVGASSDAAGARLRHLHRFPFLLPSLQLISQPRRTNFERGRTSRGTSSSWTT